jgi:hypothetical protein
MIRKVLSVRYGLPALALGGALTVGFLTGRVYTADQPHMHAALQALKTAESELNMAEHDKGGWRAKALQHVKMAITQVEKGMKYDESHDKDKPAKKKPKM